MVKSSTGSTNDEPSNNVDTTSNDQEESSEMSREAVSNMAQQVAAAAVAAVAAASRSAMVSTLDDTTDATQETSAAPQSLAYASQHDETALIVQATENALTQAVLQEAMATMDQASSAAAVVATSAPASASVTPAVATTSPTVDVHPSSKQDDDLSLSAISESAKRKRPATEDASSEPTAKRSTPTRVSWTERLLQLQEYKQEHGHLLIPIRYKKNPSLGKFVHNTREQYKLYHKQTPVGYKKKCSLTAERIAQLEEIGFRWTTERTRQQNEEWMARYRQLQDFKKEHGHCLVPHGYRKDPSFAEWIHRQRTSYNFMLKDTLGSSSNKSPASAASKSNGLLEYRFEQLKQLGFNFTVHSDKWMDHLENLKEYKKRHGDCQVPTHYTENPRLGRWVHTQRHQRRLMNKGKKASITQERINLLDELGFSWEVRPSLERPRATWQQRLDELQAFQKKHGHFEVQGHLMPQLQGWCHEQRQRLRLLDRNNGKDVTRRMGPDRVQALKAIGFTKDTKLLELGKGSSSKDDDMDGEIPRLTSADDTDSTVVEDGTTPDPHDRGAESSVTPVSSV
eukprot:Nitzschia sp. Nitz4//scaffold30_size153850//140426//142228//NITZ4_002800-RA/size153850-augustus-gene-0.77-mRNA-1//-1//CDS//3329547330//1452//frame0